MNQSKLWPGYLQFMAHMDVNIQYVEHSPIQVYKYNMQQI